MQEEKKKVLSNNKFKASEEKILKYKYSRNIIPIILRNSIFEVVIYVTNV